MKTIPKLIFQIDPLINISKLQDIVRDARCQARVASKFHMFPVHLKGVPIGPDLKGMSMTSIGIYGIYMGVSSSNQLVWILELSSDIDRNILVHPL